MLREGPKFRRHLVPKTWCVVGYQRRQSGSEPGWVLSQKYSISPDKNFRFSRKISIFSGKKIRRPFLVINSKKLKLSLFPTKQFLPFTPAFLTNLTHFVKKNTFKHKCRLTFCSNSL